MSTRNAFAAILGLLGARVFGRMLATAAGDPVAAYGEAPDSGARLAAVVPVLDEATRVGACLEGLCAQPASLADIVVVDGGSQDETREIVRTFAARDTRVRLVDAAPVPAGWNGKAWNLACGLAASPPDAAWLVCVDADVRPGPHFATSLLAHAEHGYLDAFGAAPLLDVSGPVEAALHPAFLATLVYRFGLPGYVARSPQSVQANGQCFVARRALLVRTRAFAAARASRCDDYTVARTLVRAGAQVGFFEGGALARVRMYESARECWRNWPRSLALRDDATSPLDLALAFTDVAATQALPLVLVAADVVRRRKADALFGVALALVLARFGVLAGTRRAYANPGSAFWLAPLLDLVAVVRIVVAACDPAPVWRGRRLVPEGSRA